MKSFVNSIQYFLKIILALTFISFSAMSAKKSDAFAKHKRRLFIEPQQKRCFFLETVRKSNKLGWINHQEAKKYARIKHEPVLAYNSPKDVRRVFVPRSWCQQGG